MGLAIRGFSVLFWLLASSSACLAKPVSQGQGPVLKFELQEAQHTRAIVWLSMARDGLDRSGIETSSALSQSVSTDMINSLDIGEITETTEPVSVGSISAILRYCQRYILRPYLRILSATGLRPLPLDPPEPCSLLAWLGYVHLAQVLVLMILGYLLQYMACFRRDRGFYYQLPTNGTRHEQICYGSVTFSYVVPSVLHLAAFLYTVFLFRINENEQLKNLMERVFLLSANPSGSGGTAGQRRLVCTLWVFIALSGLWMALSLITVNVMMAKGTIEFQWMHQSSNGVKTTMKVLLVVATLWHDMVQATVITSYCLQAQLLTSHLQFLHAKLLQHTILPIDWIREIVEFRKLLRYLNEELAPAICIFTVVNLSWAASGVTWLLKMDSVDRETLPISGISGLNVALWLLISVAPFVQAARLTASCSAMQGLGHEVRGRPFVYHDTPSGDLDTILLYTSSIRMGAKLFRVPVTGRYLCLGLAVGAVVGLTLGQCHILQIS